MAENERYELVLEGTCEGQPTRNVFYYLQTNGVADAAQELIDAFMNDVLQAVRATVTTATIYTNIFCKNLDNLEDFASFTISPSQAGNVDADTLPPFVCWSYIYRRATLAVHNGWKRFAGVPETFQDGGVAAGGGTSALLVAVADSLEDALSNVAGDSFNPVIMRKTRVPATGPLDHYDYEEFPCAGVDYVHIGTQNTRKSYS